MTVATETAPSTSKTKLFFPNLDGLRFISFFVVFLYHCYMSFFAYVKESSPGFYSTIKFLFSHGNLGVNFFFVLSGFLITFLLIREKEIKGRIHVGNFYVRRILRIWPLYYMCILISFAIFPWIKNATGEPYLEPANPVYYLLFAANFDFMHTWPVMPNALMLSVLWSVAVEEKGHAKTKQENISVFKKGITDGSFPHIHQSLKHMPVYNQDNGYSPDIIDPGVPACT